METENIENENVLHEIVERKNKREAVELCQKLSKVLDESKLDELMKETTDALNKCPDEFVKETIKEHIGIDRIIKHGLDDVKFFVPIFEKHSS